MFLFFAIRRWFIWRFWFFKVFCNSSLVYMTFLILQGEPFKAYLRFVLYFLLSWFLIQLFSYRFSNNMRTKFFQRFALKNGVLRTNSLFFRVSKSAKISISLLFLCSEFVCLRNQISVFGSSPILFFFWCTIMILLVLYSQLKKANFSVFSKFLHLASEVSFLYFLLQLHKVA